MIGEAIRRLPVLCVSVPRDRSARRGLTDEAIDELEAGFATARAAGATERERDVRATYGATLGPMPDERGRGSRELDRALERRGWRRGADDPHAKGRRACRAGSPYEARDLVMRDSAGTDIGRVGRSDLGRAELGNGWPIWNYSRSRSTRLSRKSRAPMGSCVRWCARADPDVIENLAEIAVDERRPCRGHCGWYGTSLDGLPSATRARPVRFVGRVRDRRYLAAGLGHEAVAMLERYATRDALPPVEAGELDLLGRVALLAAGDADAAAVAAAASRTEHVRRSAAGHGSSCGPGW